MDKLLTVLLGLALSLPAGAALPPQYQNAKDLDVMIAYAKAHPKVMASIRSIDLRGYVIHFGDDCQASFARAWKPRPPGWAGPADPLVFVRSTCPVD